MLKLQVTPKDDLQKILDGIDRPATIYMAEGVYKQKVKISCPNLTIIGANRETTVIEYGDYAKKIHADGKEYNTFRTYTLCVAADNVRLENLTVRNFNTDPATVGQCVALSVNAKNFAATRLNLVSTQDTLFLSPFPDDLVVRYRGFIPHDELYMQGDGVHAFTDCRIEGTVDFIFGCAQAYFENCDIVSLDDGRAEGYVAAPAHSLKQEHGFCFYNCNFICGGAKAQSVYLARPWRDFGKCEFINCTLGEHINPTLFDKWNDTERDKTARFLYCNLSGAQLSPVPWCAQLTETEVKAAYARLKAAKKLLKL